MRDYIQISGSVLETVFTVSTGCCRGDEMLEDVEAHIYRKGSNKLLLTYNAHKVTTGEITFRWDKCMYQLLAGWYEVEIQTNGCRSCGIHTIRIGTDCYAEWKQNNIVSVQFDDCGNQIPVEPVNYGCCDQPSPCDSDDKCPAKEVIYNGCNDLKPGIQTRFNKV